MISLGVIMSEQCNLDCGYCSMDKRSKDSIDKDEFFKDYRNLRDNNPKEKIKINFFGGEPLLQFQMIQDIVKETKMDNVEYSIPTNGINLTESMVEFFNNNGIRVSISYDGLWQGLNRPLLSGADSKFSFNRKISLIQKIKDKKSHTMIGRGNYNLLENWLFIKDKLGTNSELTLIRDNNTWDVENIDLLINGIDELFDWYNASDCTVMPNFILFYFRHFLLYESKGVSVDSCGAGESTLFYSKNNMTPCVRFDKQPEMLEKIDEFRKMPECQTCSVKNYCKKGCLFEQIKNTKPIEELCTIYRHIYNNISLMTIHNKHNTNYLEIVKDEINSELISYNSINV